jgi:hypothetical protein
MPGWETKKYVQETQRDLVKLYYGLGGEGKRLDRKAVTKYLPYVQKWLAKLTAQLTPAPRNLPEAVVANLATLIYNEDRTKKTVNLLQVLDLSASSFPADMAPVAVEAAMCLYRLWECPLGQRERTRFHNEAFQVAIKSTLRAMSYLRSHPTGALPSSEAMDAAAALLLGLVEHHDQAELGRMVSGQRQHLWKVALNPVLLAGQWCHLKGCPWS